jgi:outer membrane autotransporter protein
MTVSLEHSDSIMNTVMSHAAPNVCFSTGATQEVKEQQTGKRSWMDVSYADGKVDGSDDLGDFDYKLSSLTIGQDLMRSGDRALGAYFSFGTQKMDEHDSANQDFSSDTYHLGLYLNQANIGAWDLRGVLGYALSNHESKRQVNLSSSSTIAEADFNSHSAYIGVKGTITGYENDWVTLSPELGLSYIYYSQESIKESGDPNLSLNIDSADTHAIVASAGLNARFVSL